MRAAIVVAVLAALMPAPRLGAAVPAKAERAVSRVALARALDAWENAQAMHSREASEWQSVGRALFRVGRFRESAAAYERALQLHSPSPVEDALNISRAYASLGNDTQAHRWLALADGARPKRFDARAGRA